MLGESTMIAIMIDSVVVGTSATSSGSLVLIIRESRYTNSVGVLGLGIAMVKINVSNMEIWSTFRPAIPAFFLWTTSVLFPSKYCMTGKEI